MKVSGLARSVIAALTPDSYRVNAEDRVLKVCASVADKIIVLHLHNRLARHCLPAGRQGQGVNSIIILNTKIKALYVAVCG